MGVKLKGATSGSVSLDVPAAVSGGDVSLTLPNGVGSANQLLKNGSTAGELEYGLTLPSGNGSAGQYLRNTGTPGALEFGDLSNTGKILQIVQTTKTDQFTTTSTSFVDVTGLNVSITPSSTSSKILVLAMVALGGPQSGVIIGKVLRGTTDLLIGDASSSRTRGNFAQIAYGIETSMPTCNFQYLDSPSSTSAQTYKVQVVSPAGYTGGVNRTGYHGDNSSYSVAASSITAMEVAG